MSQDGKELELLTRAVGGDEDALSHLLVQQHDRLVAELAGRIRPELRGSLSPEDIAQEAYVVVFRRIKTFQLSPSVSFYPWLSAIAVNVLRDATRARRAAKRGGGRAPLEPGDGADGEMINLLELLAVHSRTPSRSFARMDAVHAVQQALHELDGNSEEALRLRYIEALPIADIAARMGRTEGAIHQLCHRGLRALRDKLGTSTQFFSRKS